MNIFAVRNLNHNNSIRLNSAATAPQRNTYFFNPRFGLKYSAPLSQDTVTFTGTEKNLVSKKRKNGITLKLAKDIHKIAASEQPLIMKYMNNLLQDLLVTSYNTGNVILSINGRPKSDISIYEKAATREWSNKKAVLENMTDLNGIKIVSRDGSTEGVRVVLTRFLNEIKNGNLELFEIENKRPRSAMDGVIDESLDGLVSSKKVSSRKSKKQQATELKETEEKLARFDYAPPADLKEIVNAAESVHPERIVNYVAADYTDMNYPALHFLFRLPGMERVFEVQIMGRDVASYKELDDLIYKILNNKNVDSKYQKIVDIVAPLNEPGNESIKKQFNKYRSHVFLHQRGKAPHIRGSKKYTEYFLPISDEIKDGELRQKLDINNLYDLKHRADRKSKSK